MKKSDAFQFLPLVWSCFVLKVVEICEIIFGARGCVCIKVTASLTWAEPSVSHGC